MSIVNWRKSRRSDSQGNMCVEVARLPEGIGVRDSTNPAGPRLALSDLSFADLVRRMKANELDL
jgi:hypothetical protein